MARSSRHAQRGVVAVIAAFALLMFVALAGLVLDVGHLYIVRAELQGASDACALSAARELDGRNDSLTRAVYAGALVATANRVDLQRSAVQAAFGNVTFSDRLEGVYVTASQTTPRNARYVKCAPNPVVVNMWFMRVLGVASRTVRAQAIARLAASQATCATPMAICTTQTSATAPLPSWGFQRGQWYGGPFAPGSGKTGNFNWVDFNPPKGGAEELKSQLAGAGACGVPAAGRVGQSGYNAGLVDAWNTRFGVYKGPYTVGANRPDWSGFAYTSTSWPSQANAYADFLEQRLGTEPYQGNAASGLALGSYRGASADEHGRFGANRRLAIVPVVRCEDYASSQTALLRDWACVLLLNPISTPSDVLVEFLGLTAEAGTPCATVGLPGGSASAGPPVPTLVQ